MPLGGQIPLPLVVVNLDVFQQTAVPIGQSVAPLSALITGGGIGSGYTMTGFAKRTFRISTLSRNAVERDFYRDNIVGVLVATYGSILQPLGLDVSHKWIVSSGQVADDGKAKMPGFYFAEIMLEFEGTLNVVVSPFYGLIETLTLTASETSSTDQALVSVDVTTNPTA